MNLLPTTDIFNVSNIESMNVSSPDFKQLIVKLAQNANQQNLAINSKGSGTYSSLEDLSGNTYAIGTGSSATGVVNTAKGSYIKLITFGALPIASTAKSIAHGIPFTAAYKIIRISGGATNPTTQVYIPLPFSHPDSAAYGISLLVNATHVIVTTGTADWSAWTETFIFIEYVKY